jgi:hypothetical protein
MLAAVEEHPPHTYNGSPYHLALPDPTNLLRLSPNLEVGFLAHSEGKIEMTHANTLYPKSNAAPPAEVTVQHRRNELVHRPTANVSLVSSKKRTRNTHALVIKALMPVQILEKLPIRLASQPIQRANLGLHLGPSNLGSPTSLRELF